MRHLRLFALTVLVVLVSAEAQAGHTLTADHQKVLSRWLTAHSRFRVATDQDCRCTADIENMKQGFGGQWGPVLDYHPFSATGDFNGDGHEDFAVMLLERDLKQRRFAFAVFNGPFAEGKSPALFETGLDLSGQALFFGPPRPKPYRLVRGAFESEGWILEPKGQTYAWTFREP